MAPIHGARERPTRMAKPAAGTVWCEGIFQPCRRRRPRQGSTASTFNVHSSSSTSVVERQILWNLNAISFNPGMTVFFQCSTIA